MSRRPQTFCSDAARGRGDDLGGSAGPARIWALIEHPGPWPARLEDTPELQTPAGQQVLRAAARAGARVLLVRRPGRHRPAPDRAIAVLTQRGRGQWWSRWSEPDDLAGLADALSSPLDVLAPSPEWALLVCAHGRHDTCCAVRGRGVAGALARRWPAATWECTHLGGDRFAANVLALPAGVLYGGLDADTAVAALAAHAAGRPAVEHLRGISGSPAPAQVAVIAALRDHPGTNLYDVEPRSVRHPHPDLWEVDLALHPGGPVVTYRVEREPTEPALLTCKAQRPSRPMRLVARRSS